MRRFLLPGIVLAALGALPAAAQDRGGVELLPGVVQQGGPRGLARPLFPAMPSIGAADLQNQVMPTAASCCMGRRPGRTDPGRRVGS